MVSQTNHQTAQPLIQILGQDLAGNTFWEFRDAIKTDRFRRIVRYSRKTHLGDAAVSPQWHQWLRHTRDDAPSIQEQAADLSRQSQLKHNAALADARWAAKAKYIEKPKPPPDQMGGGLNPLDSGRARAARDYEGTAPEQPDTQKTAINPGADYQPDAWSPGPRKR